MTSPTTLSLNARQWRVLMNDHLEVLKGVAAGFETIDEAGLKNVFRHLDEVRLMASAWYQNSAPQAVEPAPKKLVVPQQLEVTAEKVQPNGAAPKKGGWPKGKPRKRMAPGIAQAVQ